MYNFKETEHKILSFWKEQNIFQRSLEQTEGGKRFVFFEGPPTANGRPHIGHFLTRVYKDLFCRYKTMRGFFVLRKAGWDTHGLPVELEIEKELGFKNKKDIENYGIAKFNKKAKESVWKYKKEWEEMTEKMGFWIDMKNPYVTYDPKYIESIWNIVKEIDKAGYLYLAHKVVPFCTRCGTPLSSHEVAQGYETVKDKSVYIKFKLKNGQKVGNHSAGNNTYVLAWTTTPWTLPGNVALAVGKDINYSLAKKDGDYLIMASDLAGKVLDEHSTVATFKGSDLQGLAYEPLFEVEKLKNERSYKIYPADFVSTTDGTGIVHTAVMYGEDDYQLGTELGLPKFHTVTEEGKFENVSDNLNGKYVKSNGTEELIIKHLQENSLLFKTEDYEHEYPFCWRCKTPLLYYAKESWFIKMSALRDQLTKNNQGVNWVPEHIKDGRFGQWLKEAKDWALSRERYWGTPLPVWKCEKCDEVRVVGSYKELEKASIKGKNKYSIMRHSFSGRDEGGKMIISSELDKDIYHLTEQGKEKLNEAVRYLEGENIGIIYTSPFLRTKESAEIIGKALHVKVYTDARLSEIKHSVECEGKPYTLCPEHGSRGLHHEGGENWNSVRERLMDFMNEMETKHKGKKILIVSHGEPLYLLRMMGQGISTQDAVTVDEKWYPAIAGTYPLEWRTIPRNDIGELDPHRPYIDKIGLRCAKCRATMKKVPDLMDVWFDSGAMPYAQWHWPFENKDIFKKQFPTDFIIEGIDQTRGWFYTLLAISTLLGRGAPYKNVMVNGHTLDEKGKKMSKSLGNIIPPNELMDTCGVDATRWYFYTSNTIGEPMVVSVAAAKDKLKGFVFTLYNCLRFFELYKDSIPADVIVKTDLDRWLVSRLNGLILDVTEKLDKFDSMSASRAIESFVVEDFSNWWLRRSRKKNESLSLLRLTLLEVVRLAAPFIPYVSEDIYQKIHQNQNNAVSVHLAVWPTANRRLIDKKLEEEMNEAREAITKGLSIRKESQIKVRQPLRSVTIKRGKKFGKDLEALLLEELNVKEVKYNASITDVILDKELDQSLIDEGYAREVMRQIQDLRKEAGFRVSDTAYAKWESKSLQLSAALNQWKEKIEKETSLKEFINSPKASHVFDIEKEIEVASGHSLWIGLKKI